jgi:hypothetical protein
MREIPIPIISGLVIIAGVALVSILTYYNELDKIDFVTDEDVLPEIRQACEEKGIADISVCPEWQDHKEMRNGFLMEDVYRNTRIALGDIFAKFIFIASVPIGAFVVYSGIRLKRSGYPTEVYGIIILAGIAACILPLVWYGLGLLFSL